MKIQRKLKKRIIKTFGQGTYKGIIQGYLKLESLSNNKGVIVKYTGKKLNSPPYIAGQRNPYLIFPNTY